MDTLCLKAHDCTGVLPQSHSFPGKCDGAQSRLPQPHFANETPAHEEVAPPPIPGGECVHLHPLLGTWPLGATQA